MSDIDIILKRIHLKADEIGLKLDAAIANMDEATQNLKQARKSEQVSGWFILGVLFLVLSAFTACSVSRDWRRVETARIEYQKATP